MMLTEAEVTKKLKDEEAIVAEFSYKLLRLGDINPNEPIVGQALALYAYHNYRADAFREILGQKIENEEMVNEPDS